MMNTKLSKLDSLLFLTITYSMFLTARGDPLRSTIPEKLDYLSTVPHELNSSDYSNVKNMTHRLNCDPVEYELNDVIFLTNNDLLLIPMNITVHSSEYQRVNEKIFTCLSSSKDKGNPLVLNCTWKFDFEEDEFRILPNNSALIWERAVIPEGEYELNGHNLSICAPDEDEPLPESPSSNETNQIVFPNVTQVGCTISIISLMVHLVTYIFVPTLRNLPGYNLAALSVAFLLAYSFVLIGQIPQVLGFYCVISAVLQQNFLLTAFFCMNVLAFDVWRTLKLATEKFVIGSQESRKRLFILYSFYAWGFPLVITAISVIVDNTDNVPDEIKPGYGKNDACMMTNGIAKAIFLLGPAFSLLLINAVFFVMSSWMISSNTLKVTKDQSKKTVKLNHILYVRLALMIGLTWLVGLVAIVTKNDAIWFIFDILNSLQGLFLVILFTCTKKVIKTLVGKYSISERSSSNQTSLTLNSRPVSTKSYSNVVKS